MVQLLYFRKGHKVVIVSSGAVGVGLRRFNLSQRPEQLSKVQVIKKKNFFFGFDFKKQNLCIDLNRQQLRWDKEG